MSWTRIWPYRYTRTASNGQPVSSTTPRARAQTPWPWSTAPFNKYTHESLKLKPHIHFSSNDWFLIEKCSFRSFIFIKLFFSCFLIYQEFFSFFLYFFVFLFCQKCSFCGRFGASVRCSYPQCASIFHLPCASSADSHLRPNKSQILCRQHHSALGKDIQRTVEDLCVVCGDLQADEVPHGSVKDMLCCYSCGRHMHNGGWLSSSRVACLEFTHAVLFCRRWFQHRNTSVLPFIQNIFSIKYFFKWLFFRNFFQIFFEKLFIFNFFSN